jgi:1,2-beta-oligoglucan phosphorylase
VNELKNTLKTYPINQGGIQLLLLESGDVFQWKHQDHQINLLQGNLIDGMIANIYLRKHGIDGYQTQKLLGIHSKSSWQLTSDGAIYQGEVLDVQYRIHLIVDGFTWFYQIHLTSSNPTATYDLFYGQDVGIAHPFGILSNEAYTSQYIDHQVFKSEKGYTLLSRQNQGLTHYLQLGSDYPTVGFCTDAMQFFGLSYKKNHEPIALTQPQLPNENYQYEFAYLTLQTQPFQLNQTPLSLTFYAHSYQQQDAFLTAPMTLPKGFPAHRIEQIKEVKHFQTTLSPHQPITGKAISTKQFNELFPQAELVETVNGEILSAFLPDHTHIITQAKELKVERPHGHILLSGDVLHATEDVFATTAYMSGVFGSHTVYGNTNFHKLSGDLRHPLNAHTISGTRIWLNIDGRYRLLSLPSVMTMTLTTVTWTYVFDNDTVTITLTVDGKNPQSTLMFTSAKRLKYDLLLTQQILLDTNEYQHPIKYTYQDQAMIFFGESNGMIANTYPTLKYRLASFAPFTSLPLSHFMPQTTSDGGMIFLQFNQVERLQFTTEATFQAQFPPANFRKLSADYYTPLVNQLVPLSIEKVTQHPQWQSFLHLIPWYVHDALVHYASPHGLEQYNGAAWGTRDVLQGPFELFLTAQRFDLTKEILTKVFSRQFKDTKEFPQWFMFDKYRHIQAHESHGDVLVWPLKALASYLEATGDLDILTIPLPYMDKHTGQFTTELLPLKGHVWDIFERLQTQVIPGTVLPAYGGGDWDDTLQPANQTLTKSMVSGWTVALLYEALTGLEKYSIFDGSRQAKLSDYLKQLSKDYHQYLIVDGVPAGFVIFKGDHQEVLLHPQDKVTGLNYRLLPFNRGIISQLFAPEAIPTYQKIIQQHLRHPDGVRLMNTAVQYQGGKKTYFQRAETAANFGREIGIQYVHAHIRYIEAMCAIGDAEEAWWGLNVINPISMAAVIPHAALRQRNVYFSSSDAAFLDRYQAKKDFEKVRLGTIQVKAGWRLYSSGPGIYLQTLIQRFLGIRIVQGELMIDPQLAKVNQGLIVHYQYQGKPLTIQYTSAAKLTLPHNRYRKRSQYSLTKTATGFHATLKV